MYLTENDFERIIERNADRIRHVCRAYTNHKEDEKDLFQEIIIQIWRSLPSFDGDAKIDTWIYRIAINTAISFVRKMKTRKDYYSKYKKEKVNLNQNFRKSDDKDDPQVEALYKAIDTLNASEKAIIMMYLDNFSYAEIAYVTNISETYVGVKLNRIRKKLSKKIRSDYEVE